MIWMLMLLTTSPADAGGRCYARTGGFTTIDYVSEAEADAKAQRRAAAEMTTAHSIGAYVYASIQRPGIDLAMSDQHSLVVVKNGREVARRRGPSGPEGVPRTPVTGSSLWMGSLLITVSAAPPFEVYAIDHALPHRCGWRVDATGRVRKMKRREIP